MKKSYRFSLSLLTITMFSVLFTVQVSASANGYWKPTTQTALESKTGQKPLIQTRGGAYFTVDYQTIYNEVKSQGAGYILELPAENNSFKSFELVENTTMSEGLKAEFPEIKSYTLVSTENKSTWGKLDISPKGIFAMFKTPGHETIFIDPLFEGDTESYVLYTRSEYIVTKTAECLVGGSDAKYAPDDLDKSMTSISYNTCELRTYRLAVSATGEYTQFHGGSVSLAMAAIVTTISRVNMIYERDFAVTLTLVSNNSQVVYTNANTDPFTNGNPNAMIQENPGVLNSKIGSLNYDIGHVFGTNSGGLAGLGVVCSSGKGRGVTGSGAPIGDAFDIDYVAHEMGHQFGANHTFNNSCSGNRNESTAMEPGSGSTILAYAGICSPNVQFSSDDYFHGVSLHEIGLKINAHTCGTTTEMDNLSPEILAVPTDVYVPISTPFALTAQVTDADEDDVLTYTWEQMDNQISNQPPAANATQGPSFRSFSPDTLPTRYFPRLPALANSPSQTWERLPSVTRSMNFRVSVRDNAPGGGCTQYENTTVHFVGAAGPLKVTYPDLPGITWDAFTEKTVTWDVANTDLPPISCALVDLYLSVNNGASYPILLAENVPNTGSAAISVPNYTTNFARVMVMNDAGTFFDISNNSFTINGITDGFYLEADNSDLNACIGDDIVFTINAFAVGDFNDIINLSIEGVPAGMNATFGSTSIMPGTSTTLTLSNTDNVESGILNLIVSGIAGSIEGSITLKAGFNAVDASAPSLMSPENNAEFITADVEFVWSGSESPDAAYELQLALDSDFQDIINDISEIQENSFTILGLESETTYYWRVRKSTVCGDSDYSETFSFFTHTCFDFAPNDLPKMIPSHASTIVSIIEVPSSGFLTDVNILNISGTHSRVSDLKFQIMSPQGTLVTLANNICGSDTDFNLGFDDAASSSGIDCPPTTGDLYVPEQALSAFNGEDTEGAWTLRVYDQVSGASGMLNDWTLQLCIAGGSSFVLTVDETQLEICQGTEATFEVTAIPIFEFSGNVSLSATDLPEGVTASFNPEVIQSGETSVVTLDVSGSSSFGTYDLVINGVTEFVVYNLGMEISINDNNPTGVDLVAPGDNATATSSTITFNWTPSASPSAVYTLEIANDAAFLDMVGVFETGSNTSYTFDGLPPVQTLYWRVRMDNGCGEVLSEVYAFTSTTCYLDEADDLPMSITSSIATYSSQIDIPFSGNLTSVGVFGLAGTHNRVSDLSARLVSPSGTTVELFAQICGSNKDFNLSFADGGIAEIDCPPTTGFTYEPLEPLSAFAGENAFGTWTLEVDDTKSGAGGIFNDWSLEICFEEDVFGFAEAKNPYDISIFPNPTSGEVNMNLGAGSGIELIQLYDVSGRVLNSVTVTHAESIRMDLTTYASGIYFIRASGAKGDSSFKLIKEK